jgi:hypothetical protein
MKLESYNPHTGLGGYLHRIDAKVILPDTLDTKFLRAWAASRKEGKGIWNIETAGGEYKVGLRSFRMRCRLVVLPSLPVHCLAGQLAFVKEARRYFASSVNIDYRMLHL